jgi:hypothetical protein
VSPSHQAVAAASRAKEQRYAECSARWVSEMIRVREDATPIRCRKHVIRGLRVSSHLSFTVQRVPAHCREGRPFAKRAGVDRDRREARLAGIPVRIDHRREVITHSVAVGEMDRGALPDRDERPLTQVGDAVDVASAIAAGVLVYERLDGRGHPTGLFQTSRGRSTSPVSERCRSSREAAVAAVVERTGDGRPVAAAC